MIENVKKYQKYQKYIISGLFIGAALMFFLPLISVNTEYINWSCSMKELIDYAKMGVFAEELFGYEDEYAQLGMIAEKSFLLWLPYVIALIAACLNLFYPNNYSKGIGVTICILNIDVYFGIAMCGESALESILGYEVFSISIWKVLGLGYWLFLFMLILALLFCMLFMEQDGTAASSKSVVNRE